MFVFLFTGTVTAGYSPMIGSWLLLAGVFSAIQSNAIDCEQFMGALFSVILIGAALYGLNSIEPVLSALLF
jgi:hypothetical protein